MKDTPSVSETLYPTGHDNLEANVGNTYIIGHDTEAGRRDKAGDPIHLTLVNSLDPILKTGNSNGI